MFPLCLIRQQARSRQHRSIAQSAQAPRAEHATRSQYDPADSIGAHKSRVVAGQSSVRPPLSTRWRAEKSRQCPQVQNACAPRCARFCAQLAAHSGVVQQMVRALKACGACAGALRPSFVVSPTAPWPIFFVTARESPRCEPPVCPALPAR